MNNDMKTCEAELEANDVSADSGVRLPAAATSTRNFLELPNEIRNLIYMHVAEPFVVVYAPYKFWAPKLPSPMQNVVKYTHPKDSCKGAAVLGYTFPRHQKINGALNQPNVCNFLSHRVESVQSSIDSGNTKAHVFWCGNRNQKQKRKWPSSNMWWTAPTGLLFACRTTYQEFSPILYANLGFAHANATFLGAWLDKADHLVSPGLPPSLMQPKLQFITTLELQCDGYSSPVMNRDRYGQWQYYAKWTAVCEQVVQKMTGLQRLRLFIRYAVQPPVLLTLDDQWLRPFLKFSQIPLLTDVQVLIVRNPRHTEEKIFNIWSEVVRRMLLGFGPTYALRLLEDELTNTRALIERSVNHDEFVELQNLFQNLRVAINANQRHVVSQEAD